MWKGVVICPDSALSAALVGALTKSQDMRVEKSLDQYPNDFHLSALFRGGAPDLVFLSVEAPEAFTLAERIQAQAPATRVIGVHSKTDPSVLLKTMRSGMREFMAPPFKPEAISIVIRRFEQARGREGGSSRFAQIHAFLPASLGSGATTTALHTTLELSRRPGLKTLLVDLDLNAGLAGFMLQAKSGYSVLDAVRAADDLDEDMWSKIVTRCGSLDLLPVGSYDHSTRLEPAAIRRMIEFARQHYDAITIDLSGMMERFNVEVFQLATKIHLVCAPELPSIHLARRKLEFLREIQMADRVSVVLNRNDENAPVKKAAVAEALKLPVDFTLPSDYAGVHRAMIAGRAVERTSVLGKRFGELAAVLLPPEPRPEPERGGARAWFSLRRGFAHSA